ncbi:MAG: ABC transporter permease [Gammaproteobacteria bacterium]|nr:ABC transporter permease [Gammaproteobacteria bacterium]MYF03198.1 ABC transporter permease [Gammaproteobacteria bacterium]MYI77370.1 ABC transporter permease [Gammaproteobacteria bacterium]
MLAQIFAVTRLNILNIPSRWSSSLVVVIGIGGVVAVLVALLSMATGLTSVFTSSTDPYRGVAVRSGATGELSSNLGLDEANIVSTLDGVELAAAELFVIADIPKKATNTAANVVVRGVSEDSYNIRPELELVEGRRTEPGKNEIIVGTKAQEEFIGLNLGDIVELREFTWTVVGTFEADGSSIESEIWGDLSNVQSEFRYEGGITSIRLRLTSPSLIKGLAESIKEDPRLQVDLHSEQDWYKKSLQDNTRLIKIFALIVGIIMSVGAVFAALNTMYTAVASRTYEIATLRAIGFGGGPVVISVLVESLILAIFGGGLGALIAYLAFNGFTVSTLDSTAFSQIVFDFNVSPFLISLGIVVSVGLGMIGGFFPAIRAALLPVTAALRGE